MSVQVEKLEKNMAKLTIEVSAEEFEKGIQAAKGSGRGKQADCKAQGRDCRFEAGAF